MPNIPEIVEYVNFGRRSLLESIEGLSDDELTTVSMPGGWTIKDMLAHIIGWDYRIISILPLIAAGRAEDIPRVDVEQQNWHAVAKFKDKSVAEVLAEIRKTHQQVLDLLTQLDYTEIDRRHERQGRVITIRSYVIDNMIEHERQHALEIEQWRNEQNNESQT